MRKRAIKAATPESKREQRDEKSIGLRARARPPSQKKKAMRKRKMRMTHSWGFLSCRQNCSSQTGPKKGSEE
jgi:hypothetical protein